MMADTFQSLLRFDDTLTLCIEGLNDTCTFPCTIHPPDADASVLVTLEDKRKAGVEAFFQKGKCPPPVCNSGSMSCCYQEGTSSFFRSGSVQRTARGHMSIRAIAVDEQNVQ